MSDLIQVLNLAIQLYRHYRDSPSEFLALAVEGMSMACHYKFTSAEHEQSPTSGPFVDDVRLTVRERHLSDTQTEQILNLGQGCLNCLLDLEALLRKH